MKVNRIMHVTRERSRMGRLPDYLIIGAGKSGTTTLYRYLSEHSQLFMSNPKEPEYFARSERYALGQEWYESLFQEAASHQLCGEASPLYSLWPHFPEAAERISRVLARAKLIYLMRNPVERAYSFYLQLVKNRQNSTKTFNVSRTFEECIFPERFPARAPRTEFFADFDNHYPDEPGIFLDGSDYMLQINRYLKYFDRHQMHFIIFEEFALDPREALKGVYSFLEVPPNDCNSEWRIAANVSTHHFRHARGQAFVSQLKDIKYVGALARLSPKSIRRGVAKLAATWASSSDIGVGRVLPPAMHEETKQELREYFRPRNQELEDFLGRRIPNWY